MIIGVKIDRTLFLLINSLSFVLLVNCLICAEFNQVNAQSRPFGVGLMVGDPTGISVKYWKSRKIALDGAAAWSLGENDAFRLHGDYLWHHFDFTGEERTPVYYGLGFRLGLEDENSGIGVRFPAGITHLLAQAPIDFFFELALVFELVPETGLDLEGGVGVRFYLK